MSSVDTWLTEFQIDQIYMVLQKGYVLYVYTGMFRLTKSHSANPKFGQYGSYNVFSTPEEFFRLKIV